MGLKNFFLLTPSDFWCSDFSPTLLKVTPATEGKRLTMHKYLIQFHFKYKILNYPFNADFLTYPHWCVWFVSFMCPGVGIYIFKVFNNTIIQQRGMGCSFWCFQHWKIRLKKLKWLGTEDMMESYNQQGKSQCPKPARPTTKPKC